MRLLFFIFLMVGVANTVFSQKKPDVTSGGTSSGTSFSFDRNDENYFGLSIAAVMPLAPSYKDKTNPSSSIENSYNGLDGMGGRVGVRVGYHGFFYPDNLNYSLPNFLSFGMGFNLNYAYMPWDWKNVGGSYTSVEFKAFQPIDLTASPGIVLNAGEEVKFEFTYKVGLGIVLGGDQEYVDDYGDTRYWIEKQNILKMGFVHGPSIRLRYKSVWVGAEFYLQRNKGDRLFRYYEDYYLYPSYYSDFDADVNLKNVSLTLGWAITN